MSAETTPAQAGPHAPRERRDDRFWYRHVRECAKEAGIGRPVTDEDAQAVIDWWQGEPDPDYRPMPTDFDSPEFHAELKRRRENPGRTLDHRSVREQLLLRWGGLD
jgi:hypothetical protein